MHIFDFSTRCWIKVDSRGDVPTTRSYFSVNVIGGKRASRPYHFRNRSNSSRQSSSIVLSCGYDGIQRYDSTFRADISLNLVPDQGTELKGRSRTGGKSTATATWSQLIVTNRPQKRSRHRCVSAGHDRCFLFMMGGYGVRYVFTLEQPFLTSYTFSMWFIRRIAG